MISGFSVWFFQTEEAAEIRTLELDGNRRSKRRFVGFVKAYWPRISPEPSPDLVADRLYEVRNSLAHDLGIGDDPKQEEPRIVSLGKHALSLDEIVELERGLSHPLTVPVIEEQGTIYTIHLRGVYWALHWMLRTALSDRPQRIERSIAQIVLPEFTELNDQPE